MSPQAAAPVEQAADSAVWLLLFLRSLVQVRQDSSNQLYCL